MRKIKILVPTDFSECAKNAQDYAAGLANDMNAEIILMHSIYYNDSSFISSKVKEQENTIRYNTAKQKLDQAADSMLSKNPSLSIKKILEADSAELSISSVIDRENIDYIIMGTEGESGLTGTVFGSFTSNVLSFSPCPVFTIPVTGKYTKINTIVCATEMDETEIPAVKATTDLLQKLQGKITFFNVNPDEDDQRKRFYQFEKLINGMTDYKGIDYVTIESNDILESIEEYINETQPDLVITLGKARTFLDRLFGEKVTKKLSLHTTVPLLSFPSFHKK